MDFIEIGKVVKTHGLKGRVKALSYLESDDLLEDIHELLIKRNGEIDSYAVRSISPGKGSFFLDLEGIEEIEKAEELIGSTLLVKADHLRALPEGEYYWQQLLGLDVITEEGRRLGKVEQIFSTAGHDVYVCGGGEREILLPAVAEVIRDIDLEKKVMVVRLIEGL